MSNALNGLRDAVTLDVHHPPPGSHAVVHITGIEADDAVSNFGIYLTGIIAGVVAVDLSLSERYLGAGPAYAGELRRDVERVVGASNQLTALRAVGSRLASRS